MPYGVYGRSATSGTAGLAVGDGRLLRAGSGSCAEGEGDGANVIDGSA